MALAGIQAALAAHKSALKRTFHVTKIGVFGSARHSRQTAASDIDLLVTFAPGHKDLFNYIRCRDYLENLLGAAVDLVPAGGIKPRLKSRILKDVIYI
ncbi:MAG: nucleotidyltransferase family protein [Planctomycetota bacterium]